MCSCASCTVTDSFSGFITENGEVVGSALKGGFKNWPRGNPAGRKSAADYAAHVAHNKQWHADSEGPAIPAALLQQSPEPRYPHIPGLVGPLPSPSAGLRNWITRSYAWADGRNVFPGPDVKPVRKMTRPLLALAQELRRAA